MDVCGPSPPPTVLDQTNGHRSGSSDSTTKTTSTTVENGQAGSNMHKYRHAGLPVGTLISTSVCATRSSPSVVRDLIGVQINASEANTLLTRPGSMTSKPLDLSLEGAMLMETHSLLGASISTGHGVPNSSSESVDDTTGITHPFNTSAHQDSSATPLSNPQQSQYTPMFAINGTEATPFVAVTVPLESNLRSGESTSLPHRNVCKWNNCGQKFMEMEELVNHVNERHVVLMEGEYSCKWEGCSRKGKGFNARYKMLIHVRTHTNEKPHQCPICRKCFSRLENLKIHNRSHTGERPYVCPVAGCNKRYSNSSDRFKHTRTHLEEKPYFCKVAGCDKRYTDPSSLRKHVKTFGHYANRDHLNHYISQKPLSVTGASSKPTNHVSPAKPAPVSIFPAVTTVPPTSNITGLPEGVIVYPILVHSPSLQPHYSYVTLPGHLSNLSGNNSGTFSVAGMQNNDVSREVKKEDEFSLNQDVLNQRSVGMQAKSQGVASS
ncbi:zinc finger protein GLIS2-like [Patiria miniata]|uniref:C2H2-type domain-containing protein n=1 Tax=Patiria miniata TaxID=46514 RepID=A0A913ZTT8_PATMI|nr:zinc finger protein GLIS2-like [Patiria miniata]XP_038055158.1 zinc finger protein GLIS2-like [Patiria miniata]